jgi:type II secretory pathway component PulF
MGEMENSGSELPAHLRISVFEFRVLPRISIAESHRNHDFTVVQQLSIREKREFYTGLARLMRSGTALPTALELLARNTPRRLGNFLRALNERIKKGEPLGDALLRQRPKVTDLEASIVEASSRSGHLDRGCDQLARYFEALERARAEMLSRMAYPLVMLHFSVFALNVQLILKVGTAAYLWTVLEQFVMWYAVAAVVWLGWKALSEAARHDVMAERLLNRIPGLGPIRQKFALARFFATLDAQLDAQVNIWDAFGNAAKTSDSARIIKGARAAIPLLQQGERLSEAMAAKKVLPEEYLRSFRVAEQAGDLDAELTLMAQQSEELAVAALRRWSEWLPRLIYGCVLLYGGWQIVHWYSGYVGAINSYDPFAQ